MENNVDYGVPYGVPAIRIWELNETYDRMVAAPSDTVILWEWSLWATMSWIVSAGVVFLFGAILADKRARSNPFNGYLLGLMIPDIAYSGLCALTCTISAILGHFWSSDWCQFQAFFLMWGSAANCWLNGVIAWELHVMLRSSYRRQRYFPPTRKQVLCRIAGSYTWAAFVASWPFFSRVWNGFPMAIRTIIGVGCLPWEYDTPSTIFFYLVFLPCAAFLPFGYILWVCWDVWRLELLPPRGKRRMFAIYFLRIVAVYVFMWVPNYILTFVAGNWMNVWLLFSSGSLGHLQGGVSALVSLLKPDFCNAAVNAVRFFCCCCNGGAKETAASPSDSDHAHHETATEFHPRSTSGGKVRSQHSSNTVDVLGNRVSSTVRTLEDSLCTRSESFHVAVAERPWQSNHQAETNRRANLTHFHQPISCPGRLRTAWKNGVVPADLDDGIPRMIPGTFLFDDEGEQDVEPPNEDDRIEDEEDPNIPSFEFEDESEDMGVVP